MSKHLKTHSSSKTLTKEEIDLDCSDRLDENTEEYDEENLMVEYLDE